MSKLVKDWSVHECLWGQVIVTSNDETVKMTETKVSFVD
jgi:hypothetical protein